MNVQIVGPTGVGKSCVARTLHTILLHHGVKSRIHCADGDTLKKTEDQVLGGLGNLRRNAVQVNIHMAQETQPMPNTQTILEASRLLAEQVYNSKPPRDYHMQLVSEGQNATRTVYGLACQVLGKEIPLPDDHPSKKLKASLEGKEAKS